MDEAVTGDPARIADDPPAEAIDAIHLGTAVYTATPEIEALLDQLGWPAIGASLLDPGAGDGGFLVAALARLDLATDDAETAARAVHGYEFHPGAAADARSTIADHLSSRRWTREVALSTAETMVEERDFLLSAVPTGRWDVIAANPPYLRLASIPAGYRPRYHESVAPHARADMLYAYLQRAADVVAEGGRIGLITADRWLLNAGSSELRRRIGARWTVHGVRRLESRSAFHRPKKRTSGTPARVHPVALVLSSADGGRALDGAPFPIDDVPEYDGVPLGDVAVVRLAPWLGPDGVFVVRDRTGLPPDRLVPCFEPEDLVGEDAPEPSKWAIATDRSDPGPEVLAHLDATLHAMPPRGRRATRWLPPEPFHGRLPLDRDALVVPRISRTLRTVGLPAGTMPVNHNLVVASGMGPDRLRTILSDPRVTRARADAAAHRLEDGYRSYTTTLLRALPIPHDLLPDGAGSPLHDGPASC